MLVWIHTCPPREPLLGRLLDSLRRSDVREYEIRCCRAKGLHAVEDWMVAQLDELTERDEWVLRMEDDIVVSPHLMHNALSWPARRCPYFGVGLLYRFSWYTDDTDRWRVDAATGSLWHDHRHVAGAQLVLYRSEAWRRIRKHLPLQRGSLMDLGITEAVQRAGLRTYVHKPSLAQTLPEVSTQHCLHAGSQHEHYALDYDPEYRRPAGEQRDGTVLDWSGGRVTRFLPCADGNIVPVRVPPTQRGVGFAESCRRRVLIDHDKLHDDIGEAYALAKGGA